MTIKELIDKLVLVKDIEYKEFQAIDVEPVDASFARIEAENKIWEGLGFVLQWAKYGLKK